MVMFVVNLYCMSGFPETSEVLPTIDYKYAYGPFELKILSVADAVSKLRERVAPFRFKLAARNISRELDLKGGERILELGSGLGILGKAIKDEVDGNLEFYGVELALNPAAKSKENLIESTQADVINLPFASESFDAIVSTDVLEHIPNAEAAVKEIKRVLKLGAKAFIVIADPSEARFQNVTGHIDRSDKGSNVSFWEDLFKADGFLVLEKESEKYRGRDWRKIFNLPFLVKLKDKPGFACAFNPVNRPGTYILKKI
mgnify:FL=1